MGKLLMNRRLMAEQWSEFETKILPKNCGPVQRREMRRAFYAGAHAILFRVIELLAPETEPTAEDLQIMTDLNAELKEYAEDLKAGRA